MKRELCQAMICFGLATVFGCDRQPAGGPPGKVTSEDVRRDAGQALDTAAQYSEQAKVEFQKKLEVRLQEMDVEIAKLREQGRDLTDDAKVRWDRKLAELETKREAASVKLAEVTDSTAMAWKDVQKGAQSAWDDLEAAFREASNEF